MANNPADRPKAKTFKPLRELWPYLKPYRGTLYAAAAALLLASGAQLTIPVRLRELIDNGLATRDSTQIDRYFMSFLRASLYCWRFRGDSLLRWYSLASAW